MSGLFSVDFSLPVIVVAVVVARVVAHILIRVFDAGFDAVFHRPQRVKPLATMGVPPDVVPFQELSPEQEPGWRAKAPVLEPQPGSLGDRARFDVGVHGVLPESAAETTGRHARVEADPTVTEVMPAVVDDPAVDGAEALAVVAVVSTPDGAS